jgi:DNA-binding response OmpR family regulator
MSASERPTEAIIRILLVEDEADLATRLASVLRDAAFAVDHVADGEEGWSLGEIEPYDLAVLDLGLPKLSGLDILKRWRAAGKTMMVLVLSARGSWSERVELLNAGADDYVTKPVYPCELVARVHALLRRSSGTASPLLQVGDVAVDPAAGAVSVGGRQIDVTALELRILCHLFQRKGRVVSPTELAEHVYLNEDIPEANTIQVHIARLRKKLGQDAIRTLRGLGYKVG